MHFYWTYSNKEDLALMHNFAGCSKKREEEDLSYAETEFKQNEAVPFDDNDQYRQMPNDVNRNRNDGNEEVQQNFGRGKLAEDLVFILYCATFNSFELISKSCEIER